MVQSKWADPNMGYDFTTLAPLVKALKENYPGIVENYYHHDGITSILSVGNKHFREGLQVGDSTLLTMFGFPLLYGDAPTALNSPTSIAITAAKAKKFFGKTDVLGQTITLQSFSGNYAYRIRLNAFPFLLATVTILILAAMVVVIKTYRAANANPVNSLKTE